jgi:DNA ligase-1
MKTKRREFLQLAKTFRPGKDNPAGMYISEKLDGSRAFWDGGITRGLPTLSVPWANTINPKTGERKAKIKPISTGLWSRYGNPIIAPDWWLNQLPQMFLDGELFAGRGKFQTLRSIVAKDVPDERWEQVEFAVFSAPSVESVFQAGEIKNSNFHLTIDPAAINAFINGRREAGVCEEFAYNQEEGATSFYGELCKLSGTLENASIAHTHLQLLLPEDRKDAETKMDTFMGRVMDLGGEGAVLRASDSIWTPKRMANIMKLKPFDDDQGTVTGFTSGKETDKGSKLRGLIGNVILDYKGKRLELSGFTDEERVFDTEADTKTAYQNPGTQMPADTQGKHFKVGDVLEFRYRELSNDGIPKEARYYRGV